MNASGETDAILARLRLEFIETSTDVLDNIELTLGAFANEALDTSRDVEEIQRVIHTIKGQGTTFGFPAVTRIAHRMEDFIESAPVWNESSAMELARFADALRDILDSGVDPGEDRLAAILDGLPIKSHDAGGGSRVVRALLVMPSTMQRKLVARELAACGFHVMTASAPVKAIGAAVATPPDLILASEVMEEMSGHELLAVFRQIDKTRDSNLVLMTSGEPAGTDSRALPEGARVIHKDGCFHAELCRFLAEQGLLAAADAVRARGR
jgi:chemotaxis protein histidine kinase CheA